MVPNCLVVSLAVAAIVSAVPWRSALGQWALRAELGAARFWGGSVENGGQHRSFRPHRPTVFLVGVERRAGKLAVGIGLGYSTAGLALEGAEGLTAINGIFTVYSVSPELIYQIASFGSENRLRLHAGPVLEVWTVVNGGSETRAGGQAALSLTVPLGTKLEGSMTAGAALIPSPFARGQLDTGFERQALWRRRLAVGLAYRL